MGVVGSVEPTHHTVAVIEEDTGIKNIYEYVACATDWSLVASI